MLQIKYRWKVYRNYGEEEEMKIRLIERENEEGEGKRVEIVVKWKVNKNRRRGIPKSYGK